MSGKDGGDLSPGTRAIEEAVLSVPRGKVSTYGEIARAAGLPNGARQVVRVLCSRSLKAGLPWFRILGKGKKPGTARISLAGEGFAEQRAQLASEGVEADEDGVVDLVRYGWQQAGG